MQFLNPQFLWLLLLGIIPLLLYLFRRKSKTVSVSTLVFFKTLAREHQESAWLRRMKKWLSFVMTLLMLLLAVFVLSRLVAERDTGEEKRTVVVLLDRSASMAVRDESGETRLDAAKRILQERLERVPEHVGVALIAYDVRPEVLQPRTLKRRELVSRLEDVEIRPMAHRTEPALESALVLAGLEPPTTIWHASDHPLREGGEDDSQSEEGEADTTDDAAAVELPENVTLRELNLALDEVSNPAITAFRIRPVPLEYSRYEAYVQIALNAAAPSELETRLAVSVGGIPSQFREIELAPGERTGVTFRINGVSEQLLRLRLVTEGDDFDFDNEVAVPLPQAQPIVAAWIRPEGREDPYTRLALSSIQESGSFELLKGSPDAWPLSEEVDAVIFDGWLPEQWPEDLPAVVINPPGGSGPVAARRLDSPIPYETVRVANDEHPVLFRVSSGRVSITQTALFESRGSLQPLWMVGSEPVLAAGEVAGERLVVMGFSPGISERLPLTASFPLLMGNALLWCADRDTESIDVPLYSTGELARVEGESIEWTLYRGEETRTRRFPLKREVIEMDRIGVWETDTGLRGASHILSAKESDIPAGGDRGDSDYFEVEGGLIGGLKWWLLAALTVLLLVESWLFHRHAVY